jgi:hypothetical protein
VSTVGDVVRRAGGFAKLDFVGGFAAGDAPARGRLGENVADGSWSARRGRPLDAADGGELERTELGSRPDARKRSSSSVSSTTTGSNVIPAEFCGAAGQHAARCVVRTRTENLRDEASSALRREPSPAIMSCSGRSGSYSAPLRLTSAPALRRA